MLDSTQSVLLTLAELSIAYVGFAAIVGALNARSEKWTPGTRILFRSMIDTGLMNVFVCLIPSFLFLLSLEGQTLWTISSAATVVLLAATFIARLVQIRRAIGAPLPIGKWLLIPLSIISIVAFTVNALIWQAAGVYVLATGIQLLINTVQFLAVIFALFPVVTTPSA